MNTENILILYQHTLLADNTNLISHIKIITKSAMKYNGINFEKQQLKFTIFQKMCRHDDLKRNVMLRVPLKFSSIMENLQDKH